MKLVYQCMVAMFVLPCIISDIVLAQQAPCRKVDSCYDIAIVMPLQIEKALPLLQLNNEVLAEALPNQSVPLVGRVLTETLQKRSVPLVGRVLTETLQKRSVPLVGGVLAETLQNRSVPLVGRVLAKTLQKQLEHYYYMDNHVNVGPNINVCLSFRSELWISELQQVCLMVKLVRLKCFQNTVRRHDYRVLVAHVFTLNGLIANLCYKQSGQYKSGLDLYNDSNVTVIVGGAAIPKEKQSRVRWTFSELEKYVHSGAIDQSRLYVFHAYGVDQLATHGDIVTAMPLTNLAHKLNKPNLLHIARCHAINDVNKHTSKSNIITHLTDHQCDTCPTFFTIFNPSDVQPASGSDRMQKLRAQQQSEPNDTSEFPPTPASKTLIEDIVRDFANGINLENFIERGCAVCGLLTEVKNLQKIDDVDFDHSILIAEETVTRKERFSADEPVQEISGPVLLPACNEVCKSCLLYLEAGKLPVNSLANGLWLGEVPDVLKDLSWTEKMLIARVKHNMCTVKVQLSGMSKMKANVISHSIPMPKIYSVLPPPQEELDEVLAFLFLGPNVPTPKEFQRTPMLVRRNKVAAALEWLKLNHADYADLVISYDNLNNYPEDVPPVIVNYTQSMESTQDPESTAVNYVEEYEGTATGECPFMVHGLTGRTLEHLGKIRPYEIKLRAIEHFKSNGKVLGIGQENEPESLYNNPQLYPQMFPWLFPYGLGGMDNSNGVYRVSEEKRKQQLLMYHDKRFQLEPLFPLIALNHQQIKNSTSAGYLLADKAKFADIASRLLNINESVLGDVIERLKDGPVKPETDEEKACFRLLNDLDHVNYKVQGSITSKKYMRNEIWSLVSYFGAPSWFITFSPADVKHPVALYMADTDSTYTPEFRTSDERVKLIANNPVAGARFFKVMVDLFIKYVLGVGLERPGLYGDTAAYYGTVEQQGRLTLHLHMLVWIKNSLTPQDIRDRIMDPTSDFQKKIVEYLEGSHKGEFINGTMSEVLEKIQQLKQNNPSRVVPTETLPTPPPQRCTKTHSEGDTCGDCDALNQWWAQYEAEVDEILYSSNIHQCSMRWGNSKNQSKLGKNGNTGSKTNKQESAEKENRGCIDPKTGLCKARFPRDVYKETSVDPESGALLLKKGEANMNTFTPAVSYLLRCNHDVTSLLSGTAIKSVIAYVADYITKTPLKTHVMFESVQQVFEKNSELIGGTIPRKEKARAVITKIVNSLTAASEIGGPMASMYLLKHQDHYTSHKFKVFYWKSYVYEVLRAWNDSYKIEENGPSKVVLGLKSSQEPTGMSKTQIIAISPIQDYIHRPEIYHDVCLYDWVRLSEKKKIPKRGNKGPKTKQNNLAPLNERVDYDSDFENDYNVEGQLLESDNEECLSDPDVHHEHTIYGGGVAVKQEEEESDDELLLTTERSVVHRKLEAAAVANKSTKPSKSNSPPKYSSFLSQHPQFDTHHVRLLDETEAFVPNFVGGVIPRRDTGSREEYCVAMLTLFKPWRSGKDLRKDENTLWDEEFEHYSFIQRHQDIMKFFHIKYECNDARDDYSAKRKEMEKVMKLPFKFSQEDLDDMDTQHFMDDGNVVMEDREAQLIKDNDWKVKSQGVKNKDAEMAQAKNIMRHAGWMDKVIDKVPHTTSRIKIAGDVLPGEWKGKLDELKQRILEAREAEAENKRKEFSNNQPNIGVNNEVELVNKSFFMSRAWRSSNGEAQKLIDQTVLKFSLNTEQERAFRIVANHAIESNGEHLKMYLGGMAGTGKSQVIKALIHFFAKRNESYRFMCMAPTGAAAALIGGSTYHSVLGLRQQGGSGQGNTIASLVQIRSRLQNVEYIFMDEISMLDCHSLYTICAKMAAALRNDGVPFGGINMIFAGDFAQLPPPTKASPLYSHKVGRVIHTTHKHVTQEASIGKALWHQFTTVVILRENMRQRSQTPGDAKLRKALENLRYKSCTPEDIDLLYTRVAGRGPNKPKLNQHRFRNISVITALNSYRDGINELGVERFATEEKQNLITFYSVDKLCPSKEEKQFAKKKLVNPPRATNVVNPDLQDALWSLQPNLSKHHPGMLPLCVGMPVMIKHNVATECCVTNGAEAMVVDWIAKPLGDDKESLEMLFVKLTSPPHTIQLEGLPENVVPIPPLSKETECLMPNGLLLNINRTQIPVVPNFAMTDFGSQGRTRPNNVVDLQNCRSHQSIYTCLSRGSTLEGTIIVQPFDRKKLVGGIVGSLRQEFRELELLDEITKHRWEGTISTKVMGITRTELIHSFRNWKGEKYQPPSMHFALNWNDKDPFPIQELTEDSPWQLLVDPSNPKAPKPAKKAPTDEFPNSKGEGYIPAIGSKPLAQVSNFTGLVKDKRKREDDTNVKPKRRRVRVVAPTGGVEFQGLKWDSVNYSCAYDSLLTILLAVYMESRGCWNETTFEENTLLMALQADFEDILIDPPNKTFTEVRDLLRESIGTTHPDLAARGTRGCDIIKLTEHIMRENDDLLLLKHHCTGCAYQSNEQHLNHVIHYCTRGLWSSHTRRLGRYDNRKTTTWIEALFEQKSNIACPNCYVKMYKKLVYSEAPKFFIMSMTALKPTIEAQVKIPGHNVLYRLCGIIYFGEFHFVCRIIDKSGEIWYHDGVQTGAKVEYFNNMLYVSTKLLQKAGNREASLLFYTKL